MKNVLYEMATTSFRPECDKNVMFHYDGIDVALIFGCWIYDPVAQTMLNNYLDLQYLVTSLLIYVYIL